MLGTRSAWTPNREEEPDGHVPGSRGSGFQYLGPEWSHGDQRCHGPGSYALVFREEVVGWGYLATGSGGATPRGLSASRAGLRVGSL